jgi:hypothetical protein
MNISIKHVICIKDAIWAKLRFIFPFCSRFHLISYIYLVSCLCLCVGKITDTLYSSYYRCIAFVLKKYKLTERKKKNHIEDQQHLHILWVGKKALYIRCFWHLAVLLRSSLSRTEQNNCNIITCFIYLRIMEYIWTVETVFVKVSVFYRYCFTCLLYPSNREA